MCAGVRSPTNGRRPGWLLSASGVLAISVLAAPLVLPPAVAIAPALMVYGLAERLVALIRPTRPDGLVLSVPAV